VNVKNTKSINKAAIIK